MMEWTDRHCRFFHRLLTRRALLYTEMVTTGAVLHGYRAQLIGYPKADCLVDGSLDRCEVHQSLGLDPSKPTVLYAPTWSAFSSLNSIGAELLPLSADARIFIELDGTARGNGRVVQLEKE